MNSLLLCIIQHSSSLFPNRFNSTKIQKIVSSGTFIVVFSRNVYSEMMLSPALSAAFLSESDADDALPARYQLHSKTVLVAHECDGLKPQGHENGVSPAEK